MSFSIDHIPDKDRGINVYHIRADSSPLYTKFYEWHNTKPLHYSYSDMPHDYFVYLYEKDRIEMILKFNDHINETRDSVDLTSFIDHTIPFDPNDESVILMKILQEEIQKEIDGEILKSIGF